jgi:predicted amidophosphoribosyltransferase
MSDAGTTDRASGERAFRWRALAAAAAAGRALVGLVYPPACIACGAATGDAHTLCAACWSSIRFIERPFCERLGTPFAVDLGMPLVSPAAMADPPVFERARAAAHYDDLTRRLVARLKYNDRLDLAPALGRMMVRAGLELGREADVIVPVPLHRFRLWRRRFNQAMELARPLAAAVDKPCDPSLLARVKRTRPQVGLSRAQRGENLQGASRRRLRRSPFSRGSGCSWSTTS